MAAKKKARLMARAMELLRVRIIWASLPDDVVNLDRIENERSIWEIRKFICQLQVA